VKIAGLVESVDHVCCRYRLTPFRNLFANAGMQLDLIPVPKGTLSRLWLFRSLAKYDAVIIQRLLFPILQVKLLRTFAKAVIFDFDDAVWLRDSYQRSGMYSSKRLRRFKAIARNSDLLMAGNQFLANFAEQFAPNSTRVVPTCVDLGKYTVGLQTGLHTDLQRGSSSLEANSPTGLQTHSEQTDSPTDLDVSSPSELQSTKPLRLVWVGSSSTLAGLERIRGTLDAIGRAIPDISLRIICDKRLSLDHMFTEFVPWKAETEIAELSDSDVGISWMPDDDWSRGKCGLKVVQYMAAGLPVVANRVGVHQEMVVHGKTGFLADQPSEWIAAIKAMADQRSQRLAMGNAGRQLCEARYSVENTAKLWLEELTRLRIAERQAG
jgi:glycosyltransferase involved in cell wall biosynthesis